ncbi:MAG: hypothetical protein JF606_04720 [Burkholderiales bacterium]|jgi:magnesium chelatase family protein|nr:hypothetical protein [Burkholderiales bacterium]
MAEKSNERGHDTNWRGPLLDRIDVQVEGPAVAPEVLSAVPDGGTSAPAAARMAAARDRALADKV